MSENTRRVLEMLAEGKVSVDEAERLIGLIDGDSAAVRAPQEVLAPRKGPARYLRVVVDSNGSAEHVDVRVPLALIKAGVKLHTLVPGQAADGISEALKNHGIDADVRNLRAEDVEQLIDALSELEVHVEDGANNVRVYCE
jgi:hypothetical protein